MIIDGHAHLDPELPPADLVRAMHAAGIDKAVLIPAANEAVSSTAGSGIFGACMAVKSLRLPLYRVARRRLHQISHPDNDGAFEAARAHKEFLPFVFLNPRFHEPDAFDRYPKAKGLKLHPWLHRYRLTDALPLLKAAERKRLPVLAHLGFGPAEDVDAVLEQCPKLTLVLAHAGIPHFERLWRHDRLFFDVAAPQLINRAMIRRLVKAVGESRVVFGSDSPIGIRAKGGHRYVMPPLPDRAMGDNLASLL